MCKELNVLTRVSAEDHFHSFVLFSLTSNNPMLAAIDSFFSYFQKGHEVKEKKKKKRIFLTECVGSRSSGAPTHNECRRTYHISKSKSPPICVCV
jgi:hypothetical protein